MTHGYRSCRPAWREWGKQPRVHSYNKQNFSYLRASFSRNLVSDPPCKIAGICWDRSAKIPGSLQHYGCAGASEGSCQERSSFAATHLLHAKSIAPYAIWPKTARGWLILDDWIHTQNMLLCTTRARTIGDTEGGGESHTVHAPNYVD